VLRNLFRAVFFNGVVFAVFVSSPLLVAGIQSTTQTTAAEQSPPQTHRPNSTSTTRAEELRSVIEEDAELDYLYSVHEVGSADYLLTKGRHFVLKRYLESLPSDMMDVPELYVVTRPELKNFFRKPPNPERLKNGAELEEHWVYRGKMTRTHVFYIFERH
jgi:hypothetical protein